MGKQEERLPYFINMELSFEGLQSVPPNVTPAELFMNVIVNSMVLCGKAKNGFKMEEHKRLYRVRTDLANAVKLKESMRAKLEFEDFKFLMKCWNEHTPDPQGNELVIRVDDRLREAISQHDRNEGKVEGEEKKEGQE